MGGVGGGGPRPLTHWGELVHEALCAIEALEPLTEANEYRPDVEHGIVNFGVPTGFRDLDALTGGMARGDLWVITGLSGAGKSVLALDLVRAAAIANGATTEVFLRDDAVVDYVLRLLSAESRVSLSSVRAGRMTDDDWTRLARRIADIHGARISVRSSEPRGSSVVRDALSLSTTIRQPRVLVVDDVQPASAADELADLRTFARSTGATVVAVVSDGPDHDLEHVEAAAARLGEVVIRVDRSTRPLDLDTDVRAGEADLEVLRHRRGPVARVRVGLEGFYSRFVDVD